MRIIISMMLLLFIATLNVIACESGFLPDNDLYLPVGLKSEGGITKSQFDHVIDKVEKIYSNRMLWKLQKLSIARKWEDGTVNAYAFRLGPYRQINMFGGLARHPFMTRDGFALVLCHELGHHIGGAPRSSGISFLGKVTVEGQADYFASLKCIREFFQDEDNETSVAKVDAPKSVIEKCSAAHTGKAKAICVRTFMASNALLSVMSTMSGGGHFDWDEQSTYEVSETQISHPGSQCRLDTFFAGMLCEVDHSVSVSQSDETIGTCNKSTGHEVGLRPLCWYAPSK